jgi:hypothetical protein
MTAQTSTNADDRTATASSGWKTRAATSPTTLANRRRCRHDSGCSLSAVVVGFLAAALPITWPGGALGAFVPAILLFGQAHLPTYNWNLVQCIAIIGSARPVLTLPWIMTKNLWVSTGAHVLND